MLLKQRGMLLEHEQAILFLRCGKTQPLCSATAQEMQKSSKTSTCICYRIAFGAVDRNNEKRVLSQQSF